MGCTLPKLDVMPRVNLGNLEKARPGASWVRLGVAQSVRRLHEELRLVPRSTCKRLDRYRHISLYNPNTEERETGGSLGFTSQLG